MGIKNTLIQDLSTISSSIRIFHALIFLLFQRAIDLYKDYHSTEIDSTLKHFWNLFTAHITAYDPDLESDSRDECLLHVPILGGGGVGETR